MPTLDNIAQLIKSYGPWTYGIMFSVIFAETGLVITPFLPGDTLLFAAGLISRPDQHGLNLWLVLLCLTAAPICGDNVNYFFGKWLGPKLFKKEKSRFFNRDNLDKTHAFFEKYGSNTVILARWVPIVRTFAPFVAGMGAMPYLKFLKFSIIGAFIWVWTLVWAGYLLGNTPWVRDNFEAVMILMIVITGGPVLFEILRKRRHASKAGSEPAPPPDSPKSLTEPE